MSLNDILLLGDERLYNVSRNVEEHELPLLETHIKKMHELILEYRDTYGAGRAIAAPQTGLFKRIICINTDREYVLFNPEFTYRSKETIELWDDCMSFPGLLVKVKRHRSCRLEFRDENWQLREWDLKDDMSELLQHEYDHLDGTLAVQRAVDSRSFKFSPVQLR